MINRTRKSLGKKRIKKVKLKTLLLLSLTLIFNTYAWFLYTTTVSTGITVHVNAWKVEFNVDGDEVSREFTFDIANAYPGMENVFKQVDIHNQGEEEVDVNIEITGVRILDTVYTISDSGETGTYTSSQMINMLENSFPFHFEIDVGSSYLDIDDETQVEMNFYWEYDENSAETDTAYGTNAYAFYNNENYNNESAISIIVKITATQHEPGT